MLSFPVCERPGVKRDWVIFYGCLLWVRTGESPCIPVRWLTATVEFRDFELFLRDIYAGDTGIR